MQHGTLGVTARTAGACRGVNGTDPWALPRNEAGWIGYNCVKFLPAAL